MKQEETTQGPSVHTSKGLRSICSALTNGTDTDTDPCLFSVQNSFFKPERRANPHPWPRWLCRSVVPTASSSERDAKMAVSFFAYYFLGGRARSERVARIRQQTASRTFESCVRSTWFLGLEPP